jgi:hypothetical protein
LPDQAEIEGWLDTVRDRIALAAQSRGADLRDFAATLVCAIAASNELVTAHVGDGAIVTRTNDAWTVTSWPESGEYASTTYFVTDEVGPRLRFQTLPVKIDALAVLTDGIERLVLDFGLHSAHEPFFQRMITPVVASPAKRRDRALSLALEGYLDSEVVNERTDDDKTLILAARR